MALCGDDHKKLIDRISRIEGQVRGLKRMVEEDRDCFEVLKQTAAISGAMRALGMVVLEDHLQGCIAEAMGDEPRGRELIPQVIEVFNKFSR